MSSKKTLAVDDSWMFYIYWRETEFKTGKKRKNLQKNAIRAVQNWFETRGTPKKYELVRSRLRQEYFIWRDNLSDFELQRYKSSVIQTTGKNYDNKIWQLDKSQKSMRLFTELTDAYTLTPCASQNNITSNPVK